MLWSWRKQVRSGDLAAEQTPVFMPIQIVPERAAMAVSLSAALPAGPAASPVSADTDVERDDRIQIVLPDGTALAAKAICDIEKTYPISPQEFWEAFDAITREQMGHDASALAGDADAAGR
jgi:hypothetical protein